MQCNSRVGEFISISNITYFNPLLSKDNYFLWVRLKISQFQGFNSI